ncbi:hypothetical protein GCM10027612_23000 [Microbispora bryophytorum subsp. camponoti]
MARDGAETVLRSVDVPRGATGTAHLIMFQHALEEMLARRDAGAARPLWDFNRQRAAAPGVFFSHDRVREMAARQPSYDPAAPSRAMAAALRGRTGTLPVGIVADIGPTNPTQTNPTQTNPTPTNPPGSMALVEEARLLARDLGADVHLHLRRPDGSVERYLATPTGELAGESFAEALGTVPPDLVALAEGTASTCVTCTAGGPTGSPTGSANGSTHSASPGPHRPTRDGRCPRRPRTAHGAATPSSPPRRAP